MEINDKTKVSVRIGQVSAIVAFIFVVAAGFSKIGTDANEALEQSQNNKKEIEAMKVDINLKSVETLKMFYEIRESQSRIEEKLNQKQDKYHN